METKGHRIKVKLQHGLVEILNRLEIEVTTDQEKVYPSTVGSSFSSYWWRFKNGYEIQDELINAIYKEMNCGIKQENPKIIQLQNELTLSRKQNEVLIKEAVLLHSNDKK